ncbi:uncharacterized protein B0H18DRAFT_985602 [Fomitopsis serialis]|uniref:uncharacterized protein n=1 Tax=Fomitopsis serialis TaxID=139415 RepID=UPI002008D417|nr:uncharacterized protein B0H18DRAFT_985602 [Neoantrodia serialis]KAH9932457.1 hypothetical protein B0H18DRAFT_985602 [Neoantrodia serialis]
MPPNKRPPCQICNATESKYTCAQCRILYCSIACYKTHRASSCQPQPAPPSNHTTLDSGNEQHVQVAGPSTIDLGQQLSQTGILGAGHSGLDDAPRSRDVHVETPSVPLRPLTSLKWPYVPEESAYPDPLKRDDPKPLQLHQYEGIATSPSIRRTLAAHPRLPTLLRQIDALRGPAREAALERALGVADPSPNDTRGGVGRGEDGEDKKALRELAEAVEAAVRGGREGMLGLDWGD